LQAKSQYTDMRGKRGNGRGEGEQKAEGWEEGRGRHGSFRRSAFNPGKVTRKTRTSILL